MRLRFMIGLGIAILLIAGIGIYAWINPADNTPKTGVDSAQIDRNNDEEKARELPDHLPAAKKTPEKAKAVIGEKGIFSKHGMKVVALGDSLTQGVGDSTNSGGYVGILDRMVNEDKKRVRFTNFGHAGDRTDQLLRKIKDPKVSTTVADSDMVLITIGANDIMKVVKSNITNLNYDDFTEERAKYNKRLHQVFDELQKINPDADIYLLGFYNPFLKYFHDVPELNDIVNMWNKTGEAATKEDANLHYIPTKDLFDHAKDNVFYEDNFHPNDEGYEMMAKRVLEYISFN